MEDSELIHSTHLDAAVAVIGSSMDDLDGFEDAGMCPDCIMMWCSAMGDPAIAGTDASNLMTGIIIGIRAARLKDAQS